MNWVVGIDVGGTKISSALVSKRGAVKNLTIEPVELSKGPNGLLGQIESTVRRQQEFLKVKKLGSIHAIGIASAGPLDPIHGIWLDPTNFKTRGKSWGVVPVTQPLSTRLKLPVILENDAAAAALAEHWLGHTQKTRNFMVLTLGTGLGTGIMANGSLVRSGRNLNPEAGHVIIHAGDRSAPCGCGNFGCAEAYLSGVNFGERFSKSRRLVRKHTSKKLIEDLKSPTHSRAKALRLAFDKYAADLAVTIQNYVVLYAPEVIVLSGSFANASPYFLPQTRRHLRQLLKRRRAGIDLLPLIKVSKLKQSVGILGGAFRAWNS